ncbi:MAG: SURF1 family protein [Pseudomonadota bacterium]
MTRFIFPLALGVVGAAVLIGLGLWQLQRLTWKEGVLAEIEAQLTAPPVGLPAAPDPAADRYLPVRATGTTGGDELHVLVSTKEQGAGFRIITAFETVEGRTILLDRGYVPDAQKRVDRAPVTMTVTGNLHWPEERDLFTPEDDPAGNFWFARDVEKMAATLGTEPVLLIAADANPVDAAVMPLPLGTEGIPNNHLGYAVQWFGLAVVWLGMTLFWIQRLGRRRTA